jgi:hypothetical protein
MGLTGVVPEDAGIAVIRCAFEAGVTFLPLMPMGLIPTGSCLERSESPYISKH